MMEWPRELPPGRRRAENAQPSGHRRRAAAKVGGGDVTAGPNRVVAGRYRLLAPLGAGAMGTVWRAFDQLLDAEVALKEIEFAGGVPDEERADRVERALREARHATKLRAHPNVVTILDVVLESGLPWIVMELVPS